MGYPSRAERRRSQFRLRRSGKAEPENGGKVKLASCAEGWACNVVNEVQGSDYSLLGHIHIVVP